MQYRGEAVFLQRLLGIGILPSNKSRNKYNRVRTKLFSFASLSIITSFLFLLIMCSASVQANDEFAEKYKAYQQYIKSGQSALQKKDYPAAITNYSKAIEMSPFEINNYYNRGITYFKSGKEKEAETDFDRVIVMDPRMSSAYVYRGLCREKLEKFNDALNDYTKALKLKPNDAAIHNNMAYLYISAQDENFRDQTKALAHAQKAAELSKEKNAEILDTLANAYFVNGQSKEAVDAENKALKLEPYNDEFTGKLREYEKVLKSSH
jgi:tetratricopeptide (TPR) repeat protein